MRIPLIALIIALLATAVACKADQPAGSATAEAPSPAAPAAAAAPEGPAIGVPLDKYEASAEVKAAWADAIKGGSTKKLCEAWLGSAERGSCHEDIANKRVELDPTHHAVVFSVEVSYPEEEGGMGYHQDLILLVDSPAGFSSEVIGSAHNGGVGYAGGTAQLKGLEAREVVDGGLPELIVTLEESSYDGDTSENTREFSDDTHTGVIQLHPSGPRWRMYARTAWRKGSEIMLEGEQPTPKLDPPTAGGSALVWLPATGEVEVQDAPNMAPALPAGRVKLDALPQRERSAP